MASLEFDKLNPFCILRLSTNATNADIVSRAEELYTSAETDEQRQQYRWAKEQLLTNADVRLLHELFEMPDTQYENLEWESFVRKHRKNPVQHNRRVEMALNASLSDVDMLELIRFSLNQLSQHPQDEIFTTPSQTSTEK